MSKRVLSIAIGNEYTRVCEILYRKKHKKRKGILVYRSISFQNPENTIDDGYIINPRVYGEELRNQLKKGKLKADRVIFTISSGRIASREIILPPVKEKNIMDIIKTGASEYFPIDISDYILSYLIIEKSSSKKSKKDNIKRADKKKKGNGGENIKQDIASANNENRPDTAVLAGEPYAAYSEADTTEAGNYESEKLQGLKDNKRGIRNIRVCVYAAPSSLVDSYYNLARLLHLDIVSLDYSGNSSYQLIRRQANKGINIFVQMNEKDTLVSILKDDILILQRNIGYGINMMLDTLLSQTYFKVTNREEALELLENTNLFAENTAGYSEDMTDITAADEVAAADELTQGNMTGEDNRQRERRVRENITEAMQYLTGSVARMIDYYKSNHKDEQPDTIYITGIGSRIQGIENFFTSEIGLVSSKMHKLMHTNGRKAAVQFGRYQGKFISCVGAILSPVDFIPKEMVKKKQRLSLIFAISFITFLCIAGSATMIYVARSDYEAAQNELAKLEQKLSELPDVTLIYQQYDQAVQEQKGLEDFKAQLVTNNDQINNVILELEDKLPVGAKVNSVQFNEKTVSMSVKATIDSKGVNVLCENIY